MIEEIIMFKSNSMFNSKFNLKLVMNILLVQFMPPNLSANEFYIIFISELVINAINIVIRLHRGPKLNRIIDLMVSIA